jgi:hypothetical protein
MGAWGTETFENDSACDWVGDLVDAEDLSLVAETLARAVEIGDGYLEVDAGCEALAACEVVARLRGNWGVCNEYTESLDAWVREHAATPSREMFSQALAAIDRVVREPSELLGLWDESNHKTDWHKAVEELRSRVAG